MVDTIITSAILAYIIIGLAYYVRVIYLIFSISKEKYEYGLKRNWYPPLRDVPFKVKLINIAVNGLITILVYPVLVYRSSKKA